MSNEITIIQIEGLLVIAAIVAMLSKRFRFPYTVGLVFSGVLLAISPIAIHISLTKELIFEVLLPPLIFEAALLLPWDELRKDLSVVILFSTLGLVLAALITASGMYWLANWPPLASGIFGVLIAATDPVSVIATFKEVGIKGRLRLLVEAESLFNDGTAAVLFGLLIAISRGSSPTFQGIAIDVVSTTVGGIVCGAAVAMLVLYVAGKTTDHLLEITFTTIAAYGSFLLAEHFHWSGVLATLTAGLVVGNRGPLGSISRRGRESVEAFWEYAAFVSNSLIFLLIGIHEIKQNFSGVWGVAMIAIVLVLLGRVVAIYPIALLFSPTSLRLNRSYQHIMVWGGLRGALALALALGLPESLPFRSEIITVAFAVVAFSVVIQGMTMPYLMRRLGLMPLK